MSRKKLIYIAGPTAVGKTSMSVALAKHFKTEILSCDARQFYKEMFIGTAVPSPEEQQGVKHHFIQHKSIHQPYGAGDFEKEGMLLLEELFQKHDKVIMVGGSGLYAKALLEGLNEFPEVDKIARYMVGELYKKSGLKGLQDALAEKDPDYYQTVDLNNPRRLIRALEVCETALQPYSSFLGHPPKARPFQTITLCLHMPREQLYSRINNRVNEMVTMGLEAEAKRLYPYKTLRALQTVGYQEWFHYFDGKYTREQTVAEIQKNTRRYAKRQLTWFQKIVNTKVQVEEFGAALQQIINYII